MAGRDREDAPASTVADHAPTLPAAAQEPAEPEGLPKQIGRYRILSELGAGGMGVVYRALDPKLDREVALKRVKRASRGKPEDTKQRLLREAQAMARLGHPGVVEVYDVGIAAGTVFVAMELVEGMTLARWRASGPDWREILRVYADAGETLAAAHRAGLVHRDFKPHNAMINATGSVKVLDFGLARQLEGSLAGESVVASAADTADGSSVFDAALTTTGTFVGTPAYMAPEQFDGGAVDARADQFAFCVALWEALYGARPFAGGTLSELRASLASGPPPAPRGHRRVPPTVSQVLTQGLSLRPDARHDSMDSLLVALRDAGTVSRRWLRGGLALVGLAGVGVVIGLWDRASTRGPCDEADAALGDAWDESRRTAIAVAAQSSEDAFATATWRRIEPRLDEYASAWRDAFGEVCRATHVDKTQPAETLDVRMACLARARTRLRTLVEVLATGKSDALRRGVLAAVSLPPPDDCRTLALDRDGDDPDPKWLTKARERLAEAEARAAAGDAGAGLGLAREVLAVARRRQHARLQSAALLVEGDIRAQLGEHHAAEASTREAYMLALGADDAERAARAARALVFIVGVSLARHEEGLEWHRHARAQQDRAPRDIRAEASLASNLGALRGEMGDFAASTRHLETARELEESILAPDDLRLAATYFNLSHALSNQGKQEAALRYAQRATEIIESTYGRDHPEYAKAVGQLCMALEQQGRYAEALPLREQAYAIANAAYGAAPHPQRASALWGLAKATAGAKDHARALELFEEAKSLQVAIVGEEHPSLGGLFNDIAGSLHAQGREAEALEALQEGLAIEEASLGEDHPDLAVSLSNVGTVARELGRTDEAIEAYERAERIFTAAPGHDEAAAASILHNLAKAYHDAERWEDAWSSYDEAIPQLSASRGAESASHREAIAGAAIALARLGRAAEAAPLVRRGLEHSGERRDEAAGDLHHAMALVLGETGGDRRSAHEFATRARTIYDDVGNRDGVTRVDRWLSTHSDFATAQPKRP